MVVAIRKINSNLAFCISYVALKKDALRRPFLDLLIHGTGIVLANIVGNLNHFHRYGTGAQSDLNAVTGFYLVACFRYLAVDGNTPVVTGFVGNGPALNQPGNFQVLIQTHLTSRQRPSESCLP